MQENIDRLIISALQEDISHEDITTNAVIKEYSKGRAKLICKEDGVIAGLKVFERVFLLLDNKIKIDHYFHDGDTVKENDTAALVEGDIRAILSGERTALNFIQRMSGIATHTRKIVKLLEGSGIKLLDTRKTTPNNRIFEKYAVRVGGGHNHRFNLSGGIMLKDNHIAAAGGVKQAVASAREYAPFVHKIEVEVEDLEMVKEAVEAKADIIMLDNMNVEEMKKAVEFIAGRAETECSGNVTIENIPMIRETGIDYISSGAITYNSSILDLSLKELERIK
ncbi:MAG: carboxylating nicotinate-nucleotide diphosphorylase [Synergistaceae bacterium]|jgi:nicotinate-nucleotide pyrophosphorylase (carboxylating)|nr:carboxylating nicotinate-nucleotide diphosphorylase [Synergistaceae bacterium]MCE5183169.1 carboxylating nicotinate-nucleotide diphosphorylase [Synergistaceae bacterium]MDD4838782.1 carboxylating nicotinate-nucleotide diphosphorylase [Synergistaceae bacterium]NCB72221.1 carboxylating nicotinate-nucleotide diphosphorylase [Clostridia bacterium]PKL04768.1 MAG: nicotinate-nucleotide diphosphorylase (carboxylating) [Synergistetes bacterium HGW-Synergistetes-1]